MTRNKKKVEYLLQQKDEDEKVLQRSKNEAKLRTKKKLFLLLRSSTFLVL